MKIKFWGVRGSIPVCGKEFIRYGGDTTCVEVRDSHDNVVIIDAGTGIRRLGKQLLTEGKRSYAMLFTHSHWDHVMGFPFFVPIYLKGTEMHMMGCPFAQDVVKNMISKTMQAPSFPVQFDQVAAKFTFSEICTDTFNLGAMTITPILTSHPNHGIGYRFTEGAASFVFLTDNELAYVHPGGLQLRDYEEFARGADLLVHDSEYVSSEYENRKTWGHSTCQQAIDLALRAGVKKFGLTHHNQERTDDQVDKMVAECKKTAELRSSALEIFGVAADTEIILESKEVAKQV